MRATNVSIKENWIAVVILVALIVFAIVKLSPEKNNDTQYTRVETSEYQSKDVSSAQAPANDVVRAAPETSVQTGNTSNNPVVTQTYYWAVRLDGSEGHHIPHLLGMGEPNGQGGYNFVSNSYATTDKPFGRTEDGIYFIKEDLVLKAGMTSYCELKSSEFAWVPKKMVLAEIDGERAYIYKP